MWEILCGDVYVGKSKWPVAKSKWGSLYEEACVGSLCVIGFLSQIKKLTSMVETVKYVLYMLDLAKFAKENKSKRGVLKIY